MGAGDRTRTSIQLFLCSWNFEACKCASNRKKRRCPLYFTQLATVVAVMSVLAVVAVTSVLAVVDVVAVISDVAVAAVVALMA